MAEAHKAHGLVVLGVNGDDEAKDLVLRFSRETKAGFPMLVGGRATATAYGLEAFPTVYFIDRQGVIADVLIGADEGALEKKTRQLAESGKSGGS